MADTQVQPQAPALSSSIRLSNVISALSFALDLTEGQPMGHSVNCCVLGMRLAEVIGLPESQKRDLYYALLLKDAGCSSNAHRMYEVFGGNELRAKREVKTQDWTKVSFEGLTYLMRNVMPGHSAFERLLTLAHIAVKRDATTGEFMKLRCERGANIARMMGFSAATSEAIYRLDEHWDGKGYPDGQRGQEIPLFARILNICQTLEVFISFNGVQEALQVIEERSGTWFDPDLVTALLSLGGEENLWTRMQDGTAATWVVDHEPEGDEIIASDARLDNICDAFAAVVDAKSPYTHRHSRSVMRITLAIGGKLNFDAPTITMLRRAALLHDIGKLSVPNNILDKPGKLTANEWETVRLHPYYTQRILERIEGFQHLAYVASAHHEKLDGSGYYRNLRASQLPLQARALTVADIYDALTAKRPYRDGLPIERALEIIAKDVPHALDADCFAALQELSPRPGADSETAPE
jgi:HD-GYP domain-containing protein (c-di-GMP phosphodiesterase class II)